MKRLLTLLLFPVDIFAAVVLVVLLCYFRARTRRSPWAH